MILITGIDHQLLKDLNPQYKLGVIPFNTQKIHTLILPKNYLAKFVSNEANIYDMPELDMGHRERTQAIVPTTNNCYIVQEGDQLHAIAKKFDITLNTLKQWNGLETNYLIKGQCLVVNLNKSLPLIQSPPANTLA